MLDSDFLKRLKEIRESIYKGDVSEGANELSKMMLSVDVPEQRGELLLDLSFLSMVSGDIEEGRSYWLESQEFFESEPTIRYKVFSTFFQLQARRIKKTIMSGFSPYILKEPNNFEYYLIRGLAYLEERQFEHAQADLERANTLCPNNVLILSMLAEAEMEMGELKRAIQLNETVLEACPSFRRSLINLGILYFDAGRMEDSYRLFQCLVAYEPLNWFAWTCLGDVRMEMPGKTFQALPAYGAAIIAGTTVSQTYINMAKGLLMMGRYHRAINVLDKFESIHGHWSSEDVVPVRYFRLIVDIIDNPGLVLNKSEFSTRFKRLKPRADEATLILLHMLASSVSFGYDDDIVTIFRCHMAAFIQLAAYMQRCDSRVIHVEEAILLGMLTRMFIWNGFLFEARAILMLMQHADDAHIADMCELLWEDLYRYCDLSKHSGVDIPGYHEILFRTPNAEKIYAMLTEGKGDDIPYDTSRRQLLIKHLYSVESSDLGGMLFEVPFNEIMQKVILLDDMSSEYNDALTRFWALCESYALDQVNKDRPPMPSHVTDVFLSGLNREWRSLYEQFKQMYQTSGYVSEETRRMGEAEHFQKMLTAVREHAPEGLELLENYAANDNGVQVCSAPLDEALSGYDPMPFTVDGTAFKRILTMPEVGVLDEKSVTGIFKQMCRRYSMMMHRGMTNEAMHVHAPESRAQFDRDVKRTMKVWMMLHGRKKVSPHIFKLSKQNKQNQASAGVLFAMSGYNPAAQQLLIASEMDMLALGGWYFPKSPLATTSMLYTRQSAPKIPKSAAMLNQLVSYGMLTRSDLVEQFYNRAVIAIQEWINRHSPEALSIFFEDDLYTFHTHPSLEDPEVIKKADSGSRYRDIARVVNRHFTGEGSPEGKYDSEEDEDYLKELNSYEMDDELGEDSGDVEDEEDDGPCDESENDETENDETDTVDEEMYKSLSGCFYDKNLVHNIQEMDEQLTILIREHLKDDRAMYQDYERFNKGGILHPFALQFMAWAERHAEALYLDIARIEAMSRNLKTSDQYLVIWRLKELLTRYPYLSRLYLILGGVFARIGDTGNAMKAIQSGLEWEDRLYTKVGWRPLLSKDGMDEAIEPVEASTEFEDTQSLIWQERYVFLGNDESMYHYGPHRGGYPLRCSRIAPSGMLFKPVVYNDKGGAYDFYRLFKKFIVQNDDLRDAWLSGLATPGVYSLSDYFKHVLIHLVNPGSFPLRRQIAEMFYQLYPRENPGALARFYCDNMQPTNALPYAAYAYFLGNDDDEYDEGSQSSLTIGCLLYDMGYMESAVEYLEEAIRVKNPPPMAFLTLGCACVELRKYAEAVDYLKAGLIIDPTSDRFYYNMSLAYFELGEYEEAEKAVRNGIMLSKYPVDLNMQLMRIKVFQGEFMEALPLAKYVVSEDPDMFMSAILFPEFKEFRKNKAVQGLIMECGFDLSDLPENMSDHDDDPDDPDD